MTLGHFFSQTRQRAVPGIGTLVVGSDSPRAPLKLTLYVGSGIAEIESAPLLDLEAAAKTLHTRADALHLTVASWAKAQPTRRAAAVEDLRQAGADLASLLLSPGDDEARAKFLWVLDSCDLVQIHAADPTFLIPWNLLWIEQVQRWSGEIAMFRRAYPIVAAPIGNAHFGRKGCGHVGYAEDDGLMSARKLDKPILRSEELWAVDRLVGEGIVDTLCEFAPDTLSAEDRDLLDQWLAKKRDLLHFNCHSEGNAGHKVPSDFRLRRGAIANGDHLRGVAPGAVAFLNICRSAVHRSDDRLSLSSALHSGRARAVCATTHNLSDGFATLFVRVVYRRLAACNYNFFEAIRMAQQLLMKQLHHPMALFYIFEGDPELILGQG